MSAFSAAVRSRVAARAGGRCEYCHLPARGQVATFPIDHVIPRSVGGPNADDNFAYCCPHCNAHKWTATEGVDPESGRIVPFFNPRASSWDDHFAWSPTETGVLLGRTPVGRATVSALRINDADMVELRQLLRQSGLFPEAAGGD